VQRQWYPDDNAVATAYVWALAPVLRANGNEIQLGYSAAMQDADASRWVLAHPQQPYAVTDPRFNTAGRYAPYYTPINLGTQSVLAAATLHLGSPGVLRLNGSYGVHAADDAPGFAAAIGGGAGQPTLVSTSQRRTFTPWTGRAALELTSKGGFSVALTGTAERTAYYSASTAGVQLTYRFTRAAMRRAGL
jgi:hypothetical protein